MFNKLECVCGYIDKGVPVDVIYLDFGKAFDKVPHKRLMVKVHGIGGKIWGWIDDWLNLQMTPTFWVWLIVQRA